LEVNLFKDTPNSSFGFSITNGINGIIVNTVSPNGCADQAGMHPYDKLLKINGESIGDMGCKEVHDKMKLTGHQLILEVQRSISAKDLSQNYENQNYENLDQTELAEIARTNNTISTSNASQSNQNLDQTQIGISVNGSRGDTMTTNDGEGSSSVTVATTVKMKESQGSQISRGSRK